MTLMTDSLRKISPLQMAIIVFLLLVAGGAFLRAKLRRNKVYLLDFACYKPPISLRIPLSLVIYGCHKFQTVKILPTTICHHHHL